MYYYSYNNISIKQRRSITSYQILYITTESPVLVHQPKSRIYHHFQLPSNPSQFRYNCQFWVHCLSSLKLQSIIQKESYMFTVNTKCTRKLGFDYQRRVQLYPSSNSIKCRLLVLIKENCSVLLIITRKITSEVPSKTCIILPKIVSLFNRAQVIHHIRFCT